MTKIERTLKELSDLYRFYHKIPKITKPKLSKGGKRKISRKKNVNIFPKTRLAFFPKKTSP